MHVAIQSASCHVCGNHLDQHVRRVVMEQSVFHCHAPDLVLTKSAKKPAVTVHFHTDTWATLVR